jgi:hypothetical protein
MNKRSTENKGIQANTVKADVIAIGDNARAEQHNYASPSSDFQTSLDEMLARLKEALAQVPEDKRNEAQAIEALTGELVQTGNQEKPNPTLLEIKGESLKKAAENLASVAPIVLQIASQIIAHILTAPR